VYHPFKGIDPARSAMPKRVSIFGIPIDVINQQEIDEAAAKGEVHPYVVSRVTDFGDDSQTPDFLIKRRQRTICEVCKEVCYIDPKSYDSIAGMLLLIVCLHCLVEREDQVRALAGHTAE
jgi:hypothetical protein